MSGGVAVVCVAMRAVVCVAMRAVVCVAVCEDIYAAGCPVCQIEKTLYR